MQRRFLAALAPVAALAAASPVAGQAQDPAAELRWHADLAAARALAAEQRKPLLVVFR